MQAPRMVRAASLPFHAAALATLILSLAIPQRLDAQVSGGTVTGTVSDVSGAVIPGVQLSIKDVATAVTRTVISDAAGLYTAPNLLPGTYEITATAPGFATQVRSGITLTVGAQLELNFTMQVGQATQRVQVTGEAPAVELATSAVSAEISSTTVRELPLNGRDWTQLATLQIGVLAVRTQIASSGTINKGSRGFGDQLTNSGHRPNENNYRVNGISINDYANASPGSVLGGQLGVDGIQEFSVLTTNYSAEYGRTSGAVINAITKSGTNQLHGDAYWFLRDKNLDARNFFDNALPPFHRNQWGGSAGGPIKKDRTFIFGNFEGIRQDKSLSFHSIVPTTAARAGDLCSIPTTGTCVPNTITIDPKVAPYLPLYPFPNAGLVPGANGDTGFVNTAGLQPVTENYVTARGDDKISDKDSLVGSWFLDRSTQNTPDNLLDSTSEVFSQRQLYSLEETHVFGPGVVNVVRFGYSRVQALVNTPGVALTTAAGDTSLGLFPGFYAPILNVPGLTLMQGSLGSQSPAVPVQNSFQFYDDAFLTRGTHSLKTGFAVERIQSDYFSRSRPNGSFSFPSLTGFLLNEPKALTTIQNPPAAKVIAGRQTVFGGYVQDDWRARPNLTLNLGLRYEPATLPTEANNNFGVMQDLYTGGVTLHVPHPWKTNQTLRNFEPRVGFSWDPFHNGRTAVRGGFGIFDVLPLPYLTVVSFSGDYPYAETGSKSKLPTGSFPDGAFALVSFAPSKLKSRWIEQNPHRNYAMNWNLNVQHEITPSLTAMIGYVGSRTVHQPFTEDDANMVLPTLTSAGYLWPFPVGSGTVLNPNVGIVSPLFWDDDAFYHALQAQITKRMGHGFQAQGSYTWGKCIDDGTGGKDGDPFTNSIVTLLFFDRQGRRGVCDMQVAQNLVLNYVWQVPTPKFASGALSYLTGGWEVGGIFSASTGSPFTLVMGGDPLGQNNTDPWPFPDRLTGPGCANPTIAGNANNYLKLNCFSPPVAPASFASVCQPAAPSVAAVIPNTCMNLFGNAGRNTIIGPGLAEFDFSLFKNNYVRRISENFNVQFRAEFFNVFNRANFQSPIANSTIFNQDGTPVGGAGAINATTTDPRQIQFGLKIIW